MVDRGPTKELATYSISGSRACDSDICGCGRSVSSSRRCIVSAITELKQTIRSGSTDLGMIVLALTPVFEVVVD